MWWQIAKVAAETGGKMLLARKEGKEQAAVHKYNAAVQEQAARDVQRDSRFAGNEQRRAGERMRGQQRALYGAAGVTLDTGSPLLMEAAQAGEVERAALDMEFAGRRQAHGHLAQAGLDHWQAKVARKAAQQKMWETLYDGVKEGVTTYFTGGMGGGASSAASGASSSGGWQSMLGSIMGSGGK